MKKEEASQILNILKKEYPDLPKSFLEFTNAFQLLIAVILSAQCTDRMVNAVTPGLFAKYPDARALADAELEDVMLIIKPTGFYRNKAKSITNCARELLERFDGNIPGSVEELVTLPGVGRKTANVVTQIAYDVTEGIVVDTHVKRLSNKIGFSSESDPDKIENDLMKLFDVKEWKNLTFYLILHGRNVCDARKPDCEYCQLAPRCLYYATVKNAGAEKKTKASKKNDKQTASAVRTAAAKTKKAGKKSV